jgi:hypothetical protein
VRKRLCHLGRSLARQNRSVIIQSGVCWKLCDGLCGISRARSCSASRQPGTLFNTTAGFGLARSNQDAGNV